MIVRRGRAPRLLGATGLGVVVALVATACAEGGAVAPSTKTGTVRPPRHPVIVSPLPKGWFVRDARLASEGGQGWIQKLYLPPGSTPEHGPALAVGHFDQDDGPLLCAAGTGTGMSLAGPEPAEAHLRRSGSLSEISGEVRTDHPGYVFGRALTRQQMFTAARAARFTFSDASIPDRGLPPGFRQVAAAPVIPDRALAPGEGVELTNDNGTQSIRITAYDGDPLADVLTRFWNATVLHQTCKRDHYNTGHRAFRELPGTNVVVRGWASKRLVDEVADRLTITDRRGWDAFRRRVADVPARALLRGCGADHVIVDGLFMSRLRWVLAMKIERDRSDTCFVYTLDGHPLGGGSAGGPRIASTPGPHDVVVIENAFSANLEGAVRLVGGTAPAATRRVVISDGRGATTDATIVDGGPDPTRRYFAGVLLASKATPVVVPSVVAYGPDGEEIGRYPKPRP